MIKIGPWIIVVGLAACARTGQPIEKKEVDTSTVNDALQSRSETKNELELVSIHSDLDSDSLIMGESEFTKIRDFITKDTGIKSKPYGGGDCEGKFRQFVVSSDTLTIDKYSCGDYGFGNTVFIKRGDSVRYVREYEMVWSPDEKGNEFEVRETIYEFGFTRSTKKTRSKSIMDLRDFRVNDKPFEESQLAGQTEYLGFTEELKELVRREIIPAQE